MRLRFRSISVILLIVFLIVGSSISALGRSSIGEKLENFALGSDSLDDLRFDLKIRLLMLLGHFPSISACIIKDSSVVWYKGYGFSNRLKLKHPSMDTVYLVASVSKTVTATALMQLYEQGKFGLDDNVDDYLGFELKNPSYPEVNITFRMLLAHQSSLAKSPAKEILQDMLCNVLPICGFPDYPYPWIKECLCPDGSMYDPSYWLDIPPGYEYHYANNGFILLEYLIEQISKQSYEEYCKENIFDPLDMKNSSFHYSDFSRSQLAVLYANIRGFSFRIPYYDFATGTGGLKTSVEDLSHFLIAHMNNGTYNGVRILNDSSVELMHTLQYMNSEYGLGWLFFEDGCEGHGGLCLGGDSNMLVKMPENVGIIFFINKMVNVYRPGEMFIYDLIREELVSKAVKF